MNRDLGGRPKYIGEDKEGVSGIRDTGGKEREGKIHQSAFSPPFLYSIPSHTEHSVTSLPALEPSCRLLYCLSRSLNHTLPHSDTTYKIILWIHHIMMTSGPQWINLLWHSGPESWAEHSKCCYSWPSICLPIQLQPVKSLRCTSTRKVSLTLGTVTTGINKRLGWLRKQVSGHFFHISSTWSYLNFLPILMSQISPEFFC